MANYLLVPSMEAIKESLGTKIGTAAPKAKVIKRRIHEENESKWAGDLRSSLDVKASGDLRVNAIQLEYRGIDQAEDAPIASVNPILPFRIVFFYEYDKGTDVDNSEKRHQEQMGNVIWALAQSTDLGMNDAADLTVRGCVMGHEGLRIPDSVLTKLGTQPIHLAIGRLEVRMQSRYVRA